MATITTTTDVIKFGYAAGSQKAQEASAQSEGNNMIWFDTTNGTVWRNGLPYGMAKIGDAVSLDGETSNATITSELGYTARQLQDLADACPVMSSQVRSHAALAMISGVLQFPNTSAVPADYRGKYYIKVEYSILENGTPVTYEADLVLDNAKNQFTYVHIIEKQGGGSSIDPSVLADYALKSEVLRGEITHEIKVTGNTNTFRKGITFCVSSFSSQGGKLLVAVTSSRHVGVLAIECHTDTYGGTNNHTENVVFMGLRESANYGYPHVVFREATKPTWDVYFCTSNRGTRIQILSVVGFTDLQLLNDENTEYTSEQVGGKEAVPLALTSDLNNYLLKTGTAAKATADANGNNIASTYATKADITKVYRVKGSKASYQDILNLSADSVEVGDVYDALDTGMNYVCCRKEVVSKTVYQNDRFGRFIEGDTYSFNGTTFTMKGASGNGYFQYPSSSPTSWLVFTTAGIKATSNIAEATVFKALASQPQVAFWDPLGANFDLTDYYTKTQTDTAISNAINGLDVTGASSIGAGKTIKSWSETDGKVNIETQDISIAQSQVTGLSTALAAKAPLASPAFTGSPTAPTADAGTNSTQIATTAFVKAAIEAAQLTWYKAE